MSKEGKQPRWMKEAHPVTPPKDVDLRHQYSRSGMVDLMDLLRK